MDQCRNSACLLRVEAGSDSAVLVKVNLAGLCLESAFQLPLEVDGTASPQESAARILHSIAAALTSCRPASTSGSSVVADSQSEIAGLVEARLSAGEGPLARRWSSSQRRACDACVQTDVEGSVCSRGKEDIPPSSPCRMPSMGQDRHKLFAKEHLVGTVGGDTDGVPHFHCVARGASSSAERQYHFTHSLEKSSGLPAFPIRRAGWATGDEWVVMPDRKGRPPPGTGESAGGKQSSGMSSIRPTRAEEAKSLAATTMPDTSPPILPGERITSPGPSRGASELRDPLLNDE
eukprot:CAMPEP_0204564192 /NCGR_PEP_ID=MMETSP0661-20131031/34745_1 /ASSEMBLY_ACC=CAM_ASM_000606 /TAXON_ID=109239 /ORGANISM="Alexandrium margalefi, Strain AMGDE01CS-322" /LENGTH=290 /DNA_ID=CAMNT_0051571817 /DNA_START=32 /DNA_END=905 /DNA_ORIENTATION=+